MYAIDTVARRETFWPTGAPESQRLKDSFAPFKSSRRSCGHLVEGSYLQEDAGAGGTIFERLEWTDFVRVRADRPGE